MPLTELWHSPYRNFCIPTSTKQRLTLTPFHSGVWTSRSPENLGLPHTVESGTYKPRASIEKSGLDNLPMVLKWLFFKKSLVLWSDHAVGGPETRNVRYGTFKRSITKMWILRILSNLIGSHNFIDDRYLIISCVYLCMCIYIYAYISYWTTGA